MPLIVSTEMKEEDLAEDDSQAYLELRARCEVHEKASSISKLYLKNFGCSIPNNFKGVERPIPTSTTDFSYLWPQTAPIPPGAMVSSCFSIPPLLSIRKLKDVDPLANNIHEPAAAATQAASRALPMRTKYQYMYEYYLPEEKNYPHPPLMLWNTYVAMFNATYFSCERHCSSNYLAHYAPSLAYNIEEGSNSTRKPVEPKRGWTGHSSLPLNFFSVEKWGEELLWRLFASLLSALALFHSNGFHFSGDISLNNILCFALPLQTVPADLFKTMGSTVSTVLIPDSETPIKLTKNKKHMGSGVAESDCSTDREEEEKRFKKAISSYARLTETHTLLPQSRLQPQTPAHHVFFVLLSTPVSCGRRGSEQGKPMKADQVSPAGPSFSPPPSVSSKLMGSGETVGKSSAGVIGEEKQFFEQDLSAVRRVMQSLLALRQKEGGGGTAGNAKEVARGGGEMQCLLRYLPGDLGVDAVLPSSPSAVQLLTLQALRLRQEAWLWQSIAELSLLNVLLPPRVSTAPHELRKPAATTSSSLSKATVLGMTSNRMGAQSKAAEGDQVHTPTPQRGSSPSNAYTTINTLPARVPHASLPFYDKKKMNEYDPSPDALLRREALLAEREAKIENFLQLYALTQAQLDTLPSPGGAGGGYQALQTLLTNRLLASAPTPSPVSNVGPPPIVSVGPAPPHHAEIRTPPPAPLSILSPPSTSTGAARGPLGVSPAEAMPAGLTAASHSSEEKRKLKNRPAWVNEMMKPSAVIPEVAHTPSPDPHGGACMTWPSPVSSAAQNAAASQDWHEQRFSALAALRESFEQPMISVEKEEGEEIRMLPSQALAGLGGQELAPAAARGSLRDGVPRQATEPAVGTRESGGSSIACIDVEMELSEETGPDAAWMTDDLARPFSTPTNPAVSSLPPNVSSASTPRRAAGSFLRGQRRNSTDVKLDSSQGTPIPHTLGGRVGNYAASSLLLKLRQTPRN